MIGKNLLDRRRKMIANRRLKQWQEELDRLVDTTGITLEKVSEYLGLTYQKSTGFYVKIPRKRRMFIGIGMAFREPLDTINRWIVHYGSKKRLYSKDVSEDLVWIYLIERNRQNQDAGTNYYDQYERCQQLAFQTYMTYWNELISGSLDTADVDKSLSRIEYGNEFSDLEDFVAEHMDSFKTAYAKPRRMLATYVSSILSTNAKSDRESKYDTLGSLRGWLDGYKIKLVIDRYHFEDDIGSGFRTITHRQVINADGEVIVDEIINRLLPSGGPAMDTYYNHG